MTEQEARTKWCPMARVAVPVGLTVNRVSIALLHLSDDKERKYFEDQQKNCCCIASSCACWLWEDDNYGRCGLVRW